MIDIKAYGSLKNGGFWPRNSRVYIQQIKDAGTVDECLIHITGSNRRSLDQNSYAWAVCNQIAVRMNQDWEGITSANIYRKMEKKYCQEEKMNTRTGEVEDFTKPLKEQPTDKFFDIVEEVRMNAMQTYPDIHIDTPAQHYGLSEQAYDLWKLEKINYAEAKRMSKKVS